LIGDDTVSVYEKVINHISKQLGGVVVKRYAGPGGMITQVKFGPHYILFYLDEMTGMAFAPSNEDGLVFCESIASALKEWSPE